MAGRPRSFIAEQVLADATQVFWRKGYEATALSDLESATGLGRQSLYGAFGDKHALFERVVEHYFDSVLRPGLIDVLDAAGSGRANVEKVFAMWEAVTAAPEWNGCLIGNSVAELSARDAPMATLLQRKLQLVEEAFHRALRRAQRAGEVPPTLHVRSVARSLVTTAQGLAVVARVQRDPAFIRSVIQSARRLLD
jgi:TetR/AcrR family transcriptional repressor of nem operon